jgi:putative methyltransferase (TIGR04325 family)
MMRWSRIVRPFVPVGLLELRQRLRSREVRKVRESYIWQGVHESFRQVESVGEGFEGNRWVQETENWTETIRPRDSAASIPSDIARRHMVFLGLLGKLAEGARRLRIVDFGGGLGMAYHCAVRSLRGDLAYDHHVVELGSIYGIAEGNSSEGNRLTFHRDMGSLPRPIDLLYANNVIQYIEDYSNVLRKLAELESPLIFLAEVPAGEQPSYASGQTNVEGTVIPCWFFNLKEIDVEMARAGYKKILDIAFEFPYDQTNFPEHLRILSFHHLLYSRKD